MIVTFLGICQVFILALGKSFQESKEEDSNNFVPEVLLDHERLSQSTDVRPLCCRAVTSPTGCGRPKDHRTSSWPASAPAINTKYQGTVVGSEMSPEGTALSLKASAAVSYSTSGSESSLAVAEVLSGGTFSSGTSEASSCIFDGSWAGSADSVRGPTGLPSLGGFGLCLGSTAGSGISQPEEDILDILLNNGVSDIVLQTDQYGTPSRLGGGTYGQVYRGSYRGTMAAVKVKAKLDEEVIIMQALMTSQSHERFVSLYHSVMVRDNEILAMELCVCNLRDVVSQSGTPGLPDNVIRWSSLQMLTALQCLQQVRVIHLDVKPDNFLLTHQGQIKLCDFGVSLLMEEKETETDLDGSSPGTEGYKAPEVIRGGIIGFEADLFSLGVTMFEMYTARLPWRRANDFCVLETMETVGVHYSDKVPVAAQNLLSQILVLCPLSRSRIQNSPDFYLNHEYYDTVMLGGDANLPPDDIRVFLMETTTLCQ